MYVRVLCFHRCFPELGHRCAKAYYMPCTPDLNWLGGGGGRRLWSGCPDHFLCTGVEYRYGDRKEVCVPDHHGHTHPRGACRNNFDCAYNYRENAWTRCRQGRCVG